MDSLPSLRACASFAGLLLLSGCNEVAAAPDAPVDAGPSDATPDASPDGGVVGCSALPIPSDVATRGTWDPSFTLPGLTGLDGFTPIVRDVAPAPDGSAIVVGYFHWAGTQRVEGVARLVGHTLAPLAEAAALPLAREGYAAAVVAPDGSIVLAPYRRTDSRLGTLVQIDDTGVHELGTFTGNVRSLAYVDGALWALGTLSITDGPSGIAIYEDGAWHGVVGGDPDGPAYEVLVRADGDLVIGGEFARIGGIDAMRVARFDGTSWSALDMPDSGRVVALAEDAAGTLYAGGVFSLAPENLPAASIAEWTGSAWAVLGGGVAAGEGFGAVSDLLVDGDGLVVVGCFDHVGGGVDVPSRVRAEGLARFGADAWTALDDGAQTVASHWFAPFVCGFEPDPAVVWEVPRQRVAALGTELVFGGAFGGLGGVASQSVIARGAEGFVALGEAGQGLSGQVIDLDVGGPSCTAHALVAASHIGGEARRGAVVALDGSGWRAVSPELPPGARCQRLAVDGAGRMFLACDEDGMPPDYAIRSYVLASSGSDWVRIGDVLSTVVQDIAIGPDGAAWVVMGAERGGIARVVDDRLEMIDGTFDGAALSIAFGPPTEAGFDVVVGGVFANVDVVAAARIARWDGAWHALGTGLTSTPSAIAVSAGGVYAATQDEGNPGRLVLGYFDGTSWVDVGTPERGLPAPFDMTTHTFTSLAVRGDVLLASGYVFPESGGRNVFAYVDGTFRAVAGGVSAMSVDAMAITESGIVFGGSIAEVGLGASTLPSVGVARLRY